VLTFLIDCFNSKNEDVFNVQKDYVFVLIKYLKWLFNNEISNFDDFHKKVYYDNIEDTSESVINLLELYEKSRFYSIYEECKKRTVGMSEEKTQDEAEWLTRSTTLAISYLKSIFSKIDTTRCYQFAEKITRDITIEKIMGCVISEPEKVQNMHVKELTEIKSILMNHDMFISPSEKVDLVKDMVSWELERRKDFRVRIKFMFRMLKMRLRLN